MTRVLICDLSVLDPKIALSRASTVSSFDELKLSSGRRDNQRERVGGYLALLEFYSYLKGWDLPKVKKTESGAPFLFSEEKEPYISISHSANLAAIMLCDELPCGVDVQEEKDISFIERIESSFLLLNDLYSYEKRMEGFELYLGELSVAGELFCIEKCGKSLPYTAKSGICVNKSLQSEKGEFYKKWSITEAATKSLGKGLASVKEAAAIEDRFLCQSFGVLWKGKNYALSACVLTNR